MYNINHPNATERIQPWHLHRTSSQSSMHSSKSLGFPSDSLQSELASGSLP